MRKRWFETVYRMARREPRVLFIGSDLTNDELMRKFSAEMPEQFFMEGISEAQIVGMASGLAVSGKIVYVNTIASFLTRRCYEQNAIDLGMANANVRLMGNGGGLVYGPLGPTHLATEDFALMKAIPNMTVIAPADADEMEKAVLASLDWRGPIYFRVAKGGDPIVSRKEDAFAIGKAVVHRPPATVTLVTTGVMLQTALQAYERLLAEGLTAGVVHFPTLKPMDEAAVRAILSASRGVITLEEHVLHGGLGSSFAEAIAECPDPGRPVLKRMGLPDFFIDKYGSQAALLERFGLGPDAVVEEVRKWFAAGSGRHTPTTGKSARPVAES